jgi:hypothetical protein
VLPFLKKQVKHQTGVLIKHRPTDPTAESEEREDIDSTLDSVSRDIIDAVASSDVKKLTSALRDAFEIMELAPHLEGPHLPETTEE